MLSRAFVSRVRAGCITLYECAAHTTLITSDPGSFTPQRNWARKLRCQEMPAHTDSYVYSMCVASVRCVFLTSSPPHLCASTRGSMRVVDGAVHAPQGLVDLATHTAPPCVSASERLLECVRTITLIKRLITLIALITLIR